MTTRKHSFCNLNSSAISLWFYHGGQVIGRREVSQAEKKVLFGGRRFGHFFIHTHNPSGERKHQKEGGASRRNIFC
jgi:hypothetical protein